MSMGSSLAKIFMSVIDVIYSFTLTFSMLCSDTRLVGCCLAFTENKKSFLKEKNQEESKAVSVQGAGVNRPGLGQGCLDLAWLCSCWFELLLET